MAETTSPDERKYDLMTQRVTAGIEFLDEQTHRLRRANAGLLASGIVGSAASTLVTGVTAANGPVVGDGPPGWRLACTVAAVFSFITTVAVGLNQRLKIGERLAEQKQCAGRLRALEIALTTGSREWDQVVKEYEELVRAYPDLVPDSRT